MKKWFLMVPLMLFAIRWLAIESFERYSEVPVCEERENRWDAPIRSCSTYDQMLASHYRVLKGEVYWEHQNYAPEFGCGQGPGAIGGNLISFKCWMQRDGYARTVEHRTLIKVETYSPSFKILEGRSSVPSKWQKRQFNNYAIGQRGVYYKGYLMEHVDPDDFEVIFPFGNEEEWSFINVARAGKMTFVQGVEFGEIDLAKFRLIKPSKCPENSRECFSYDLTKLLSGDRDRGVFGSIGKDLIFLSADGAILFKNKSSSGMFTFSDKLGQYIYTGGVLYELSRASDELTVANSYAIKRSRWFRPDHKAPAQPLEGNLGWQHEQIMRYDLTSEAVYFDGERLPGADPNDLTVVFPFGTDERWKIFNISRSGKSSFVGARNVGKIDFNGLRVLPPCKVFSSGVSSACWSEQRILRSVREQGVVTIVGEDVFYFSPYGGVRRFIGAASVDLYAYEKNGVFYIHSDGESYKVSNYTRRYEVLNARLGQGME